jgi:hypothetical protein
MNGTSL